MNTVAWWCNENWGGPCFTWDVWYGCNFRCSYCWWEMDDLWVKLAASHKLLPPQEWLRIWEGIRQTIGESRVDVIGGEPLRYPKATELFIGLARMHRVSMATNLSVTLDSLRELTSSSPPDRIHLSASYHPEFVVHDEFVGKVRFLKDSGYEPNVTLVAWPPFFDRLLELRHLFREMGVPFTTIVFQGKFEGREYPAAYTAEQLALLGQTIPEPAEVDYRLHQRGTRGKLCGAGHVYANVKGNGDVFRCGQDAFGLKPMGNIFEPTFRLHTEPRPCPYEHCSCGEFFFLWESWPHRKTR